MNYKNIVTDLKKQIEYNYFIKEEIECGIILLPWEVRSIRTNGCSIINSYASFKKEECWLNGMIINFYDFLKEKDRNKKILMHKKEIKKYQNILKTNKMSAVPSMVYWKNNLIKIQLCFVKGKKKFDKRESEKMKNWKILKSDFQNKSLDFNFKNLQ